MSAITHRRDAVYPTTIVGLPPQEDYYLGKATERIFLPLLRTLVPDVEDYHLPRFGCFHNAAWMRIRKAYPLQARRVMHSVWGAGQMAWTKTVVVVDDATPLHREEEVWRTLFRRCRFDRDVELVHGPLDILDHAARGWALDARSASTPPAPSPGRRSTACRSVIRRSPARPRRSRRSWDGCGGWPSRMVRG